MARPSLNDLTAFVTVATRRSFRRAADELGTAPSTLSHAMRALEERMGVRLLNRTTRSVSPTEAGFELLGRLQPALATLDEALDSIAIFRGSLAGTVRINAPRLGASLLVRDVLPAMADRFPDVVVDLVVEGKLIDIVAAGFDAGVRLVDSIPKDMIAVPFAGAVSFVCIASPAYLERFGEPHTPDELTRHRCIGHRVPNGKLYRWEFERAGQMLTADTIGPLILDDEELMVDAAIKGLGIAYVASPAAEAALAEGRLRRVLAAWTPAPERVAIYYPGHRAVPPTLRAFLDVAKTAQS
ncbi:MULTISPECIES: LysR family transcriptional regulator [unclassified Bosea (in: a-proteobacteria)]|uniref:LysR family transcriptional regulator n=1 Tax=unclassified Bosea (in: a-proteobacteria) TaxID=2653178 RepID=UPI000F753745|nr:MULTISPECIES: LysR family transcriptional regulator [unclassified Bosea (in: a-proteobacteria)]AZO77197.1 LysR family transcriptional regulator [Bosea sp. Tri-49]RXT22049.1 LysR family transcriptional regulator [Bosea sp. Tri-39]RXT32390.1 LysR family transcriptional regulator [Bosea sp. Tri-54]